MKKLLFLLIFPLFSFSSEYIFTCLCSSSLSDTYNSVDSFIIDDNLEKFNANLDSVEKTLDKNIEAVQNDTLMLEELNKTLKLEIAQLTEYKVNLEKNKSLIFRRE